MANHSYFTFQQVENRGDLKHVTFYLEVEDQGGFFEGGEIVVILTSDQAGEHSTLAEIEATARQRLDKLISTVSKP